MTRKKLQAKQNPLIDCHSHQSLGFSHTHATLRSWRCVHRFCNLCCLSFSWVTSPVSQLFCWTLATGIQWRLMQHTSDLTTFGSNEFQYLMWHFFDICFKNFKMPAILKAKNKYIVRLNLIVTNPKSMDYRYYSRSLFWRFCGLQNHPFEWRILQENLMERDSSWCKGRWPPEELLEELPRRMASGNLKRPIINEGTVDATRFHGGKGNFTNNKLIQCYKVHVYIYIYKVSR